MIVDMKMFVNVARLEIGQLLTQGVRQGHPCTLDTFLVKYDTACIGILLVLAYIQGSLHVSSLIILSKNLDVQNWHGELLNSFNHLNCHNKTNKRIRPVWSESSLYAQWVAKDPSFLQVDSEDSDQTGRMSRLIWVFAGRTCHFVGFVMRRLK